MMFGNLAEGIEIMFVAVGILFAVVVLLLMYIFGVPVIWLFQFVFGFTAGITAMRLWRKFTE